MATTAANAASETLLVRGYWKAFVNMTDATTPICGMRTDLSNPAQTQSGSIIVKWFKGQPGLHDPSVQGELVVPGRRHEVADLRHLR